MNGEFLIGTPVPTERANIVHRGRKLQYLTIAWNSLECVIALVAGFLAGSIALVGFGFDSAIGLPAASRLFGDCGGIAMKEREKRLSDERAR